MRRAIALTATAATVIGLAVASAPASADTRTPVCGTPTVLTDLNMANLTSAVYRMPSGRLVTVTRQTDAFTASYAAGQGTLERVCYLRRSLPPRR